MSSGPTQNYDDATLGRWRPHPVLAVLVRVVLLILPALAASSPVFEGSRNGWLDGRLFHYVANQRRLPEIIGPIVPEPVASEEEYRERILEPMYRAIAPDDPEGLMQDEWLNSRAAIARFSRGSIEIRCLDAQECPSADLAICRWAVAVLKLLIAEGGDLPAVHRRVPPGLLRAAFLESARAGMAAALPAGFPCEAFGLDAQPTVGAFLRALDARLFRDPGASPVRRILDTGSLAERILAAAGPTPSPARYREAFARLCECPEGDLPFTA